MKGDPGGLRRAQQTAGRGRAAIAPEKENSTSLSCRVSPAGFVEARPASHRLWLAFFLCGRVSQDDLKGGPILLTVFLRGHSAGAAAIEVALLGVWLLRPSVCLRPGFSNVFREPPRSSGNSNGRGTTKHGGHLRLSSFAARFRPRLHDTICVAARFPLGIWKTLEERGGAGFPTLPSRTTISLPICLGTVAFSARSTCLRCLAASNLPVPRRTRPSGGSPLPCGLPACNGSSDGSSHSCRGCCGHAVPVPLVRPTVPHASDGDLADGEALPSRLRSVVLGQRGPRVGRRVVRREPGSPAFSLVTCVCCALCSFPGRPRQAEAPSSQPSGQFSNAEGVCSAK